MTFFWRDFRWSHSTAINVGGWRARALNILRLVLGNSRTLRMLRILPFKDSDKGLLCWTQRNTHMEDEYALLWMTGAWHAFIVARAETEEQYVCFQQGGLTLRVPA